MLGPQVPFGGADVLARDSLGSASWQGSFHLESVSEEEPSKYSNHKQLLAVSDLLDINILRECRRKFLEYGEGENGDSLKVEKFIEVLSCFMPRHDVESIYKKIDVNDDGYVDWQEFTGFLINSDTMKGAGSYGPSHLPTERAVQPPDRHTHRDMIEHLSFSMKPYPMIVTGCRDGTISIWNAADLSYNGSISHHDKNSLMVSSMVRSISTAQKAAMKMAVGKLSSNSPADGVYITAMTALSSSGHLCVASADCSLSVYDLFTHELSGRLNNTTEIVTAIEAFQILDKRADMPASFIINGDCLGYISVIELGNEFAASSDGGQKKRNQQVLGKVLNRGLHRVKLHDNWVSKLHYLCELGQLLSASLDGKIKFVNIDKMEVTREFKGHNLTGSSVHVGVKSFCWAPEQKYICSVGTDRVILMWDPYTLDIMCKLTGLSSPVLEVGIDEKHQQLMASTQKKSIRTWDSVTYEALEPVEDRTDYLPINEISCSLWIPEMGSMVTASSRLKVYTTQKVTEEMGLVEQDDISCALFNDVFHQVVIISKSGRIKTYLSEDGSLISSFDAQSVSASALNGSSSFDLTAFVKIASFDFPKRRLIIITASNEIQLWNCHNGSNLCVVTPRVPPYIANSTYGVSSGNSMQITSCLHASIDVPIYGADTIGRTVTKKHILLGNFYVGLFSVLICSGQVYKTGWY